MDHYVMVFRMIIDATITIGNMIEIGVIAAGGIAALVTVKNSVNNLGGEVKRMKEDFLDVKNDIKKFGDALIRMALQEQRIANVEMDVRELRHGRGFVEVNDEYPRPGK